MSAISEFISRAQQGGSVYLFEVKQQFDKEGTPLSCVLSLPGGGERTFAMGLPEPQNAEEAAFIKDYFYARIYNILSMLGGSRMVIHTAAKGFVQELACSLGSVFGEHVSREKRSGYAKCLNVADRMNAVLGAEPFSFSAVAGGVAAALAFEERSAEADVLAAFQSAVKKSANKLICGMDVGGTDIKVVGSKYGHIDHIKEYDWNPSSFTGIDSIIEPVLLLARLSRALLSLGNEIPEHITLLKSELIKREASIPAMQKGVEQLESYLGEVKPLDGVGLSFPDIVVRDKIVGGETHKTKGVREHSSDYESEFGKLTALNEALKTLCHEGGKVHLTNDGPMAAYTAAVELAHSPHAENIHLGIFAHSLGTELGTGWVNKRGEVPEYPLEVYNVIIDLGNYPAKALPASDVRSLNNFNTSLSGTLQKFTGQSGAFRLAEEYYKAEPALYDELFKKGFITRSGKDSMVATVEPLDMRKKFLEHLMVQAENGEAQARRIFEQIGEYLAATWLETEAVLAPAAKPRVLFGRFVKRRSCFELMLKGARKIAPQILLLAADDELAYTQLMCELRDTPLYSVAQFAQAVGAVYFAASVL